MAIVKFIDGLLLKFNDLENDAISIENKWNIFTATNQELDHIGNMLDILRFTDTDDDYRKRLLSKIAINTSKGDIEDLKRVFKIISDATKVRIINHNDGMFGVELNATELYSVDFLNIPSAGFRIAYIHQYDDNTFTLDDDLLGLDNGELAENIL